MKTKKLKKKLSLNKTTITHLNNIEKIAVNGGRPETQQNSICYIESCWVCTLGYTYCTYCQTVCRICLTNDC